MYAKDKSKCTNALLFCQNKHNMVEYYLIKTMKCCFYNDQKVNFCQQYKQNGVVNTESDFIFYHTKMNY